MLVITFNRDNNGNYTTVTYSYTTADNEKTFWSDTKQKIDLTDGYIHTTIVAPSDNMYSAYYTTYKIGWKVPSSLPEGCKLEASGETTDELIFFTIDDNTTTEATFPLISNTKIGTMQLYMAKKITGRTLSMGAQIQFKANEDLTVNDRASLMNNFQLLLDFITRSEFYDYSYYTAPNYDLLIDCEFAQGAL